MTPQPKITGWSTLIDTRDGKMVVTIKARSAAVAAAMISSRFGMEVNPAGMHRTVTVVESDFGNPLSWAAEEMDLDKCEEVE